MLLKLFRSSDRGRNFVLYDGYLHEKVGFLIFHFYVQYLSIADICQVIQQKDTISRATFDM